MSFDITYKICCYSSKQYLEEKVDKDDDEDESEDEVEGENERTKKVREKDWNLGVFSVFRQDCKPLICGICLILQERVIDFEQLFEMFFDMTKSFPQTIITDQQKSLMTALENFKRKTSLDFGHLLDQFHIIRNAGRSIKNNEELTKMFKKLVYTKSQN